MDLLKEIQKSISSSKRSILYDVNKKTNEILQLLKAKDVSKELMTIVSKSNSLDFPKKTLEDFKSFDEEVKTNEDYNNSFVSASNTSTSSKQLVFYYVHIVIIIFLCLEMFPDITHETLP